MRMSDLILLAGSPVKGDARCLSTLFHLQWTGTPVVDSRWPAWSHTGFSKALGWGGGEEVMIIFWFHRHGVWREGLGVERWLMAETDRSKN